MKGDWEIEFPGLDDRYRLGEHDRAVFAVALNKQPYFRFNGCRLDPGARVYRRGELVYVEPPAWLRHWLPEAKPPAGF